MASFDYFHSNAAILISQIDISKLDAVEANGDEKEDENEGKEEEKQEEKLNPKILKRDPLKKKIRRNWRRQHS